MRELFAREDGARPARQAPSINPVPTPALSLQNEDRSGVAVEPGARRADATSPKVVAELVVSKSVDSPARENEARPARHSPSIKSNPTATLPLRNEDRPGERPREVPAANFAALLPSEKVLTKWLLSHSANPPARAERPARQVPSIKPVPTPPLPLRNEDRPGVAVGPKARRNDTTSRKVVAERVPSKSADSRARENEARTARQAPSIKPVPIPPLPQRNEDRSGVAVEPEARRAEATSPTIDDLFRIPQLARRRSYGTLISFALCVILPTLAIAAYLYHFASDEYFAEFRFSVQQGTPSLPGTSVSSVLTSGGSSSPPSGQPSSQGGSGSPAVAAPQDFMVNDYLSSGKAVDDLQRRINVKALYSREEINRLERFDARAPMENFVTYFHHFLWADFDEVTGVAIVTVKAFTAQDALLIAKTLAELAENLINEMNMRADRDAVRFAEKESESAEQRLNDARARLLQLRTNAGVINPSAGSPPSVLTTEQLSRVQREAAQHGVGAHALADVVGKYEQIIFDQQYAQDSVLRARQTVDLARANAAVQHFYIEPYVTPELPESPTYPMRALDTCLAGLAIFGAWLLGLLLVRTIQDHAV
jgi:capsular polysaccharide transport system permease protein